MHNLITLALITAAGIGAIVASLAAVSVIALVDKLTERWADDDCESP